MKAIFCVGLFLPSMALAQVPNGYYNSAQNLSGAALQSALHDIIDNHTQLSYGP